MSRALHIVGAGLAGCEAAWQAAQAGAQVVLHEMRPLLTTQAHQTDGLAELVCSNSFRSDDWEYNAVGLLHAEMRRLGSLIMACADINQTPAGGALAVDRLGFSQAVSTKITSHPRIEIVRGEVTTPGDDWRSAIVATGPLTSPAMARWIIERTGEESLAFFDAIAPIVHVESIDMAIAWKQSRYDKAGPGGTGADYINCPMTRAQYESFHAALLAAPKMEFRAWEEAPYFDGCLPIEVMAERGHDALRFGPMKPVGLTNAHDPAQKPHAVVQLRQDNALGSLWNLVGFQTKMKHAAQTEVFRMIPGLEHAVFARLGGVHRNTFLNSPRLLDGVLRLRTEPRIRFAGQVTGVEGYVESAAIGLLAGRFAAAELSGLALSAPPPETALGALIGHITGGHLETGARSFQPMNINYGLLPPLEAQPAPGCGRRLGRGDRSRARKRAMSVRALDALDRWAGGLAAVATPRSELPGDRSDQHAEAAIQASPGA